MSTEHYYLISSLPALSLGVDPETTSSEFLERCRETLPGEACNRLEAVSLVPTEDPGRMGGTEARWHAWETYMRNHLANLRGHHLGVDPEEWLLPDADAFPTDRRQLDEILAEDNPARRERALDRLRWTRIDDFAAAHQFDFDRLVVYRLHLLLAEKWAKRSTESGRANRDALVEQCVKQAVAGRRTSEIQTDT